MLRVVIDIRESELWDALEPWHAPSEDGWIAERAALAVGDIAFYGALGPSAAAADGALGPPPTPLVVLERKTAEDLGASLRDGRYREQRARLQALRGAGVSVGYVIEAPPWSPTLSRTWCRGAFTEVQLQTAITRIQMRYGLTVLQASSVKETVQWIRRIAKALVADPAVYTGGMATTAAEAAAVYTEAIHVKKAENSTPERIFLTMLLAIPGLGRTMADAIAAAVGNSLTALQALTVEQLADLKAGRRKVGVSLATVIHAALHS
jgi:ERCC4-type nuclease